MTNPEQMKPQPLSRRIESIDVIRGLTILAMIFVNDISGVPDVPTWMKHMPTLSDGMTFVDLVFPAFLFIVGMAIPFSIGRRFERRDDPWAIWKHIFTRILGLLIIGFYMVNSDEISDQSIINYHLWIVLMYLCVMIIWNKSDSTNRFLTKKWIVYSAVIVLVILAFLYRGEQQEGLMQMRTYWWGILGLIGWAYLVACMVYIPFRKSQFGILCGLVLLYCFYMADEAGMLSKFSTLRDFIHPSSVLGSHTAIILSGTLIGNMLQKNIGNSNHLYVLKWSFGFSLSLFLAGLLLHELHEIHIMFIISKNLATVPWCLISSALTIWIWMVIYWIMDMKGFRTWAIIIEPAGTNALFAYILAPLVIECFALLAYLLMGFNLYTWLGQTFFVGFLRAIFLAFAMTWLAGYLSRHGIQLKL